MAIEARGEFEIKPGIVHVAVYRLGRVDWVLADNGWAAAGPNALEIAVQFAGWAVTEIAEGRQLRSDNFSTTVGA